MTDFYYNIETGHDGVGEKCVHFYWTTKLPKEPGWYWTRREGKSGEIEVVFVHDWGGGVFTGQAAGSEISTSLNYYSHWLGPLPEPELPE